MKKMLIQKVKGGLRRVRHHLPSSVQNTMPSVAGGLACKFNVDGPAGGRLDNRDVSVEGWLIPDEGVTVRGMRLILPDASERDIPYGLNRPDVARAFPDTPEERSLKSGFALELSVVDGGHTVQVDLGNGYKTIHTMELRYSPERLVADIYNPHLAERWAEHVNLMDNRKAYYYEDANEEPYVRSKDDPRLIAFYLPQYHPLLANEKRFGKGFTEWTNVTSAAPRFVGHQQPVLPRDMGFYDLRLDENLAEQAKMAKHHGVYAFCFYYFWFSGKRVLERPIDSFVAHKEWDFNYMICWANENWTKNWDGRDKDVFLAQSYAPEDPLKFIKDVEHILTDKRYVREDGKPVLMVYRALDLKEPKRYAQVWREYMREKHGLELHLVSAMSFDAEDPATFGFDKAVDFAPQTTFFKNDCFEDKKYPYIDINDKRLDNAFGGSVADYRAMARNDKLYDFFDFPTYKSVIPAWDNDPRQNRRGKGFVCQNTSPDLYAHWLDKVIKLETATRPDPIVFLNAWNEWGEGALLEPTQHQGRAILNHTTEVLSQYSHEAANRKHYPLGGVKRRRDTKLAVMVHLYYLEGWPLIRDKLAALKDQKYDLYVTLNRKDEDFADTIREFDAKANISIVPNRGRDVLPFVIQARRLRAAGYEYVLKLHGKRSTHRDDGTEWFSDVVTKLLPSSKRVAEVLDTLESGKAGVVGPDEHVVSLVRHMGSNHDMLHDIIKKAYDQKQADKALKQPQDYPYFGGTMFWARLDALAPILDLYWMPDDFQSEGGQVDGTMAHALERAFGMVPKLEGKPLYTVSSKGVKAAKLDDPDRKYTYAP